MTSTATAPPQLIVFAGPNGSGKSTITRQFQKLPDFPAQYINPDDIAAQLPEDSLTPTERARTAQQLAEQQKREALANGTSFSFETVMSHPSKLAMLQAAKRQGFEVTLVFVATNNPRINVDRVALRVIGGGHDVPADKIVSRYHRTLKLLPNAISVADRAYIFDNTDAYSQAVVFEKGTVKERDSELPAWVEKAVEAVSERMDERQQLLEVADERGLNLVRPDIESGCYDGKITLLTNHYAIQKVSENSRVVHDRLLANVNEGETLRISYSQGVSNAGIIQIRNRDVEH